MTQLDIIRLFALVLSISLFVFGIYKPFLMPLSYITCFFFKLPHYYPFLTEYRYEFIIIVAGTIRTLVGKNVISRLKMRSNKYLFIFLFTVFISYIFAWDKAYSWENTLYDFGGNILLYFMILCSINSEKELKLFIWLFMIIYTFMSWEPVYYFLTGREWVEEYGVLVRAEVGLLEGHRGLANTMNQIIPISFFLIFTVKNKMKKIMAGIPLFIFITALILGKARIGVVGFILFIMLLIYYSEKRSKYMIIGGSVIICLLLFSAGFSSTFSRIDMSNLKESPTAGLFHGIEMVLKGNIFGVGPGCYPLARKYYFTYSLHAHSLYGELIGDLGIPGTMAFILFIGNIFYNIKYSIINLKTEIANNSFMLKLLLGLQISLIVRLFIGLASHSLYIFYWYFVAALSIVVYDLSIKQKDNINTIINKNYNYVKLT